MVGRTLRFLCCFTATLVSISSLSASSSPKYNVGDTAEEDIVAPAQLTVVDAAATKELKRREAERIPVHLRYYIHSLDQAEAALRAAYANTRDDFLYVMDVSFHRRMLTEEEMASEKFRQIAAAFQKQNRLFPVDLELARLWALGESDQTVIDPVAAKLRAVMEHHVYSADIVSADTRIGAIARLVPLDSTNEIPDEQIAAEHGINVAGTNLISVQRARTELVESFPPDQHAMAKYAESFVAPDCVVDRDLTLRLRARRTGGLLSVEHYGAGQIIVKRGQVINSRIKAALDQLQGNTAFAQVHAKTTSTEASPDGTGSLSAMQWIVGLLAATVLLLAVSVWQLARRRTLVSLLPARIETSSLEVSALNANAPEILWRERALLAEQRAQQAQAMARSGLLAHLAQWMSDKLVRRLISQRKDLLDDQHQAAAEINQLEERIEVIHSRMQNRVIAYERRIAELERELQAHGETNRELIRAEILKVRKQLELERKSAEVGFD